ncbi:recombinase [Mycobacterium sherrisii]|uniref:Recombinase n=2 Tax=Mycobacterium sherrisii TaxID=243061 RepID=A0A1E3T0M2_9MYCO|nr:phosphotransacetylase [Mycobacterium sherrisii]ODR08012.1 recombinase [Mycobacterium sherrisii]ORW77911.1 recombinase [Mycobacterium sherrisii]
MAAVDPRAGHGGLHALRASWRSVLAGRRVRVALADGEDPRVIAASVRLSEAGTVAPHLVGRRTVIQEVADRNGIRPLRGVSIVDVACPDEAERVAAVLRDALSPRLECAEILELQSDPLYAAAALLRMGSVEACVGGASRPTAEVLRAGLRVIGTATGTHTLSSCFVMALPSGQLIAYGDCAVVPMPDDRQLAEIAVATAMTYRSLTGAAPVVAMLSFSTMGSAAHAEVDKVRRAAEMARRLRPGLPIEGELQFDAAFVADIGARKAPGSVVAGQANVMIFPNLDAGNIGYKITQRIGGAAALGPILQGFAKPINDLSRGCSVDDIEFVALASAVQAVTATAPLPK